MLLWAGRAIFVSRFAVLLGWVRKVWTHFFFLQNVERMVKLEAPQASAGSQLSDALLPVAIRSVWREIWLLL
jgi:hypothetical protein